MSRYILTKKLSKSIEKIVIPSKVKSIGTLSFNDCISLKELDFEDGIEKIGADAFRDCSSITKITLPDGLHSVGSFALYGLSNLESITLPSSLSKLGEGNLVDCSKLKSISISSSNERFKSVDGILYSADMKTLIIYPTAKTEATFNVPEGVVTLGNSSFKGCKSIKTVICSSTVENVGDFAFRDCSALETLTLGSAIKRLGVGSCYDCKSLSTVNYPNDKETWEDKEKMILANTWNRGAGKYKINYEYKG